MMRCAIYARAATKGECEVQLSELRGYVARRGWSLASEYVDIGAARPQLAKLMAEANRRRIDRVVVWTLGRWGRSLVGCLGSIQELHDRGIGWIAVSQGIDMDEDSPGSRAQLTMLAALMTWGSDSKRERIKAGMLLAKRRGGECGRPKLVFDRELVGRLHEDGKSIREIARELGVGRGTVERILSVPKG